MGVTERLAMFVTETTYESLPKEIVNFSKTLILDWLGSAFAGSTMPPGRIMLNLIRNLGGREESTIIATADKTSCINAALANGTMGHIAEIDDLHYPSITHPGAVIHPAALSIGEREKINGKDLLTSVVVGYETTTRIGNAVIPSHYEYWHSTSTCGTFGAAATASKILELDKNATLNALGIAGTEAAGLRISQPYFTKHFHAGKAAQNGILAALLAQNGFTGPTNVLEDKCGYIPVTSRNYDLDKITDKLGKSFETLNTRIKLYPCCGCGLTSIDATLKMIKEYNIEPEEIEKITIGTVKSTVESPEMFANFNPTTIMAAKLSLPYCTAAAVIDKQVTLNEFSERRIKDPKIKDIMKKIDLFTDPQAEALFPKTEPAEVKIKTKDGKEYSYRANYPRGSSENPASISELREKFANVASFVFSNERIKEIVETVDRLEDLDDISKLTRLLSRY